MTSEDTILIDDKLSKEAQGNLTALQAFIEERDDSESVSEIDVVREALDNTYTYDPLDKRYRIYVLYEKKLSQYFRVFRWFIPQWRAASDEGKFKTFRHLDISTLITNNHELKKDPYGRSSQNDPGEGYGKSWELPKESGLIIQKIKEALGLKTEMCAIMYSIGFYFYVLQRLGLGEKLVVYYANDKSPVPVSIINTPKLAAYINSASEDVRARFGIEPEASSEEEKLAAAKLIDK